MQVGPGARLGGRYRLLAVLGRGGMADVYEATDEVLGRPVAVKVFRPGVDVQAGEARQLLEMRTLARLNHPNIVTIFDAGNDHGTSFVVMQLVPGSTLAEHCRGTRLAPDEVARIGTAVADALAHVHANGMVHRDVKPGNVLIGPGGEVFLTDFGIVRLIGRTRLTEVGTIGTASYLSPEQVRGEDVTPSSDVYALGLVLLECLTGTPEYPGSSVEAAVARLSRPPRPPDWLPPAWRELLTAMTAAEPARRPAVATVAARLRDVTVGSQTEPTVLAAEPGAAALGTEPLTAPTMVRKDRKGWLPSPRPWPGPVVAAAALGAVALAVLLVTVLPRDGGTSPTGTATPTVPAGPERLDQDLEELQRVVEP